MLNESFKMKKVCLLFGGKSIESEISCLTAFKTKEEFDIQGWDYIMVFLNKNGEFFKVDKSLSIDDFDMKKGLKKGEFKKGKESYFKYNHFIKEEFDIVLILGHGKGIEDGQVGAFFDTLQIPCIYSGIYSSSLIQDKDLAKMYFKKNKIPTLDWIKINKHDYYKKSFIIEQKIEKMGYPLICKPSSLGSSIGINIIRSNLDIKEALSDSFLYDNSLIIEPFIEKRKEINIALAGYQNEINFSSFEILTFDKGVYSFEQKYEQNKKEYKEVKEYIEESLEELIKKSSKKIFVDLSLCGVCRFDFIFDEEKKKIYLNEINIVPGSLAYNLFLDKGIEFSKLLEIIIRSGLRRNVQEHRIICSTNKINLKKLSIFGLNK